MMYLTCLLKLLLQPKGKQGTKGQKQIYEENRETMMFYSKGIVFVNVSIYQNGTGTCIEDI